ncbi:formylglycine-generating enzyme family protein [Wenzhouxiangella sp. EGI_FJ10305]|uniref:formylglycine-generating enzyme family protein n=1 Tax=Wenzhouxiangella sp. EGI_FJ10305 TaxID=3243768 RepID=UPI0035E090A2
MKISAGRNDAMKNTDRLLVGILIVLAVLLGRPLAAEANDLDMDADRGCVFCPVMVDLSAGTFDMGAPSSEPQSSWTERPVHEVSVPAFSISRSPVTFSQWDTCFNEGGCSHSPSDQGWGRGDRPVVDVSWHDAQEYVQWLSNQTGQAYRLPTEAEWEYAARAGTVTRYNTGTCIETSEANFQGGAPAPGCPGGSYRQQTTPVETFAPNPWGLYDMHGNVWEWVEDCWNQNFSGAPDDGSAWTESGDCGSAVLRGGSWSMGGRSIRSATRAYDSKNGRIKYRGFRVARSD